MVEGLNNLTGWLRPPFVPAVLVCGCLMLAGCTSFSSYVSDHWPTWAGGMPNDIPPRPGEPGYAEFISHQEAKDEAAAANKPGAVPAIATAPTGAAATPAVATGPAVAAPAAARNVNAQSPPPTGRSIDTQAAVQGGLY